MLLSMEITNATQMLVISSLKPNFHFKNLSGNCIFELQLLKFQLFQVVFGSVLNLQ